MINLFRIVHPSSIDSRSSLKPYLQTPLQLSCQASWQLIIGLAWWLGTVDAIRADDRLVFELEETLGRGTVSGTILDITGSRIKFQTIQGTIVTYSADDVIELQTLQTDEHRDAKSHMLQGQWVEADTAYQAALEREQRLWMRREILAEMVQCSLRQGDYARAGSRFLLIVQSDSDTQHYSLIPLKWSFYDRQVSWTSEAERWIELSLPTARLMGASVLLEESARASQAERVLEALATDPDRRVARLARLQLWRLRLRAGDITTQEPLRWQDQMEELPENLRYGGYYLLGQAFLQQGARDRAAAALLWLPMTDSPDYLLTARATLEAAELLESIGQTSEAQNLFREVARRFPDTPMAAESLKKLDKDR